MAIVEPISKPITTLNPFTLCILIIEKFLNENNYMSVIAKLGGKLKNLASF